MPSLGGALGGASTGASIGSFAGPIGTLIGGGIGALAGGLLGGKSPVVKNLEGKIDPVQSNLINWSGESHDYAKLFRTLGLDQAQGVDKYLRALLGNNTDALNAALGSQRQGISQAYQTAKNNVSEFGARGGASAGFGMQADFKQAGDLGNLAATARNNAVGQLNQAAGQNTNAGIQFGGQATAQSATVLDSVSGLLGGQQSNARQNSQANGQSAYQLGQLLGPILGKMLGGGSGSAAPGNWNVILPDLGGFGAGTGG